jgi:hypothetical protein
MNNLLNELDDDLFTPISEPERASLIGGGKTKATTTTSTLAATFTPTGVDTQMEIDVDRNTDQTGLN